MDLLARPRWLPGGGRTRRYLVLIVLVLVAVMALPPAPSAPTPARSLNTVAPVPAASGSGHWTAFHGGENHSGFSPENGPSVGTLSWLFAPPTGNPIRTGIVANGSAIFFADDFGVVWAYNLSYPPTFLWNRSFGTTLTTPDVWNAELLIGGSNGRLNAVDTTNGNLAWSQLLDGSAILQGLAVDNGTVFAGTSAGSVWALNATFGTVLWHTSIGQPIAGAIAVESGTLVADTAPGSVVALSEAGRILWTTQVGAKLGSGPAIFAGSVYVGDASANVSRLDLASGSVAWRFVGRTLEIADAIQSTPAVDPARVYVETFYGQVIALDRSNGSLAWNRSTGFTGYAVLSSPAIAPNGLYVSDAYQYLDDFAPSNGTRIWSASLSYSPAYGPPAIEDGLVVLGIDLGTVYAFGPVGGPPRYPVSGTVRNATGAALVGATVVIGAVTATTTADGAFTLRLANGTYPVTVSATGYDPLTTSLVVGGPVGNLTYTLSPVPVVRVTGRVVDAQTLRPLSSVPVFFFGAYGSEGTTNTTSNGSFALLAPVGMDYVTASPPNGYQPYAEHVAVPPTGRTGLVIGLPPAGGGFDLRLLLVPVGASVLALVAIGVWAAEERRARLGMPPGIFSPFATYVAERVVLVFFQAIGALSILYVFGTMLPAASFNVSPCAFIAQGCQSGGWRNPINVFLAFGDGMGEFVGRLFTGQWGLTSYGHLTEPAVVFLQWYGPNSIELALFALPLAGAIAYVVGLWAGAHPESTFDSAARLGSIGGLLVPSFLIVLLFFGTFYGPFLAAFGDTPYGFLPTPSWFALHGSYPKWIGSGGNTTPTGFPLADGAIHGDWVLFDIVLMKTLWQAAAIAVVYVSIYLRFVRHAVTEAFREPNIVAARARGIPESTILWRHTGRRVLPMLVLVFGLTLPLYIGTQALVEAIAQDNGIGTLLIDQMSHTLQSGFGFRAVSPGQTPESFYQVTIFLLVLVVLSGELVADILARYLDPRLLRSAR